MLELREQEKTRVGGQQLRDTDRRGVRPVRGAERVVDEEVTPLCKLAGELGSFFVSPGWKRVLEHLDPLVRKERAQMLAHGLDPERGILALRPAEVRADAILLASRSSSNSSVGSAARMRVSSATLPSSSGTFSPPARARLAFDVRVADGARQPHSDDGSSWTSSSRLPDG